MHTLMLGKLMNIRRLRYFVKIVDLGSLTQAAEVLHIAQPALSQQLNTLESEFKQQLLIRTKRGVTPTAAGLVLYQHAQIILRQLDQACSAVVTAGEKLSGPVSVGLAPGTAASALALPLLQAVRHRHPSIVLYLNENFGTTLSELVMNGRMDMAVLYGFRSVQGLEFVPLQDEELYLLQPATAQAVPATISLQEMFDLDLLLPRSYNVIRKLVDAAFMANQRVPCVIAEIESVDTLAGAVAAGLGATVLPDSAASHLCANGRLMRRRIVGPVITAPLALCLSSHLPLSAAAQAVKSLLLELVGALPPTVAAR